jgi:hypothetical protein
MQYGNRTWLQISKNRGKPGRIQPLSHVAEIIEEHNMNLINMCQLKNYHLPPKSSPNLITYYTTLQTFYSQPELYSSRHTNNSLAQQLTPPIPVTAKGNENYFTSLSTTIKESSTITPAIMTSNNPANHSSILANITQPSNQAQKFWVSDTSISVLTEKIQDQLIVDEQKKVDARDEDSAHVQHYFSNLDNISTAIPVNQRI